MAATNGPNGLQTMVDLELEGVDGSKLDAAVRALQARQNPPARLTPSESAALALTWADLKERHSLYDCAFWEECRALYAGGQRLFGNPAVFERLFPKNMYEDGEVYKERKRRAHYFPYPGTILDALIAGLGSDPLRVSFAIADEETGALETPPAADWWTKWVGDVTDEAEEIDEAEGGDDSGCTLHEFMTRVVRETQQTQRAWILVEIDGGPNDDDGAAESTDPSLRVLPAEGVIDWEEDDDGELEWVLALDSRKRRRTLKGRRAKIEQTFTLWTTTTWVRYVVEYDPGNPPKDSDEIVPTSVGSHGFGVVPILRFEVPEGMWGMGKMHSLAREHLNKRCAMSWAEYKSLFPILYEFQGAEDQNGMPVPSAQQDRARATNQLRAQGYSQVRGNEDRAEFVGPPADAFVAAREGCKDTMREMHRIMYSMAMSADMGTQALARSGESKAEDKQPTEVILDFLGLLVRYTTRALLALVARGKGTALPPRRVQGLEHFDTQGVADAIDVATKLFAGIPIKSAKFAELALSDLYGKYLGDAASQADRETIREQVREQVSAEDLLAAAGAMPTAAGPLNPETTPEDPNAPGDPNADPANGKPTGGASPGSMYSSKRPKKK